MVHASVMYPSRKAYTRDMILHEKEDTTPTELATRLNLPLGEALVILYRAGGRTEKCSLKHVDA